MTATRTVISIPFYKNIAYLASLLTWCIPTSCPTRL